MASNSNVNPCPTLPSSPFSSDQSTAALGSLSLDPRQSDKYAAFTSTSRPSSPPAVHNEAGPSTMSTEFCCGEEDVTESHMMSGNCGVVKGKCRGVYKMQPLLTECSEDGSSIRFNMHKYQSDAFNAINEFRLEDALCDVVLVVHGEEIKAHKLVLAACSRYFKGMFTRNMLEASSKRVDILEPSITAESMIILVEFAYTCSLLVTEKNVQSLLLTAVFLEIPHVIEACSIFLEQHLDPSNCIGFARFAALQGCFDLEKKCKKFTEEHFCDVVKNEEFLALEDVDMMYLVQKDELTVKCESEIFQACLRWVDHKSSERTQHLESLLKNLRLTSIAPSYLRKKLQYCALIKGNPRVMEILADFVDRMTQHRDCEENPRKPCQPQVIYSFGGFSMKTMASLSGAECYHPKNKEWTRIADMPTPRCGAGVAVLQGQIYIMGGSTKRCGQCFDACSLSVYNPSEDAWYAKCPLSVPRNRVGVGVLDNLIYAIGGSSSGEVFNSAERYDFTLDAWEPIAKMATRKLSAGVAVINRLLYTVGGFDGVKRLRSVECYHPEDNEWHEVQPMRQARSGAGVAALGGYIYAVGGFDGERQLKSVERYDVTNKIWEEMTSLSKARSGMGVAVLYNKLYTVGGFDGTDFLSCIEYYDPDTDTWHPEAKMLCEKSGQLVTVSVAPKVS